MPVISMFYGIIVSLYFQDNRQHHRPHIHAKYQADEAVIAIPDGELLDGYLPPGKMKMLLASDLPLTFLRNTPHEKDLVFFLWQLCIHEFVRIIFYYVR